MPAKKIFFSAVIIVAAASAITAFTAPATRSDKKNEIKQQTAFDSCKPPFTTLEDRYIGEHIE